MKRSSIQLDRAAGAVLASAAGDALGSQYEFGPTLPDTVTPTFGHGHFGHAPGEWTDDTSMAMPILEVLAAGDDINADTCTTIVQRWRTWSATALDVGRQTHGILARLDVNSTGSDARAASEELHERSGKSAGNGSLMRTGPLALGYLDREPHELANAAAVVAELTHWEPDNAAACTIWSAAIRHAILTGELAVREQTALLSDELAARWNTFIDEALTPGAHPRDFTAKNGWVVCALQGALAAVAGATSLTDAVERAIRGGHDTDTVAAIAGALAGAVWGATAVPLAWKQRLHGWPGYTGDDLVRLAVLAAKRGQTDAEGWPTAPRLAQPGHPVTPSAGAGTLVTHPHDASLLLGSLAALDRLPDSIGAVVSLCRIGTEQVRDGVVSVPVWLVDQPDRNANLDFVLEEAANMIASLRAAGHEVFLHCAEGRSRTAAVATLYSALHCGIRLADAWETSRRALPEFAPQAFLRDAVERIVAARG